MNPSHDFRRSAWTPPERLARFYQTGDPSAATRPPLSTFGNRRLALRAAFLSSATLAGACRHATDDPSPSPSPSGTANAALGPDTRVHSEGEQGRALDYVMSFDSVKDCPRSEPSSARKGFTRIGVDVDIQATSARQLPVNVFYASLFDANGDAYTPTLMGCDPPLPSVVLVGNARVRGYVTFEVPMLSRRLELRYAPPVIGQTDEELRFSVNR